MNKYSAIAAGVVAAVAASICAPAIAHGGGGWSVTIESQPQPYYYSAPPPVFYPQAPFPYGPPPSAFTPPPPTYQYRYQQHEPWPGQQYQVPHGARDQSWRDGEWRDRGRHERDSRHRGNDNDRPGANNDLPRWGYRDQHHHRR